MYTIKQIACAKNQPNHDLAWLVVLFSFDNSQATSSSDLRFSYYQLFYSINCGGNHFIGGLTPESSTYCPVYTARGAEKTYIDFKSPFSDILRAYDSVELLNPVNIQYVEYILP